jgi:hypothetical protein
MPNKPRKEKPGKADEGAPRTGPGSGAGRGNDLPSESETQRDTRRVESQPRTVEREVATGPDSGSQNIDAAK